MSDLKNKNELENLKSHCIEQMRKLPRTSKMYEEHLLTLSIIDTNEKYFNEIEKLNKIIDLILEEQIEEGYLVNFNSLEEAKKYYENKYKIEELEEG